MELNPLEKNDTGSAQHIESARLLLLRIDEHEMSKIFLLKQKLNSNLLALDNSNQLA